MYAIVHAPHSHQLFRRSLQLAAVQDVLPDRDIHAICREFGYAWRNRHLPPGGLVRSMIYRGLSRDRSIAAVLADLAALTHAAGPATDAAWCQARDRLPEAVLVQANDLLSRRMRRRFGAAHTYQGRPVFLVDGTGVSMPDTPALAKAFGYTRSKQYASRFPVARVTVIGLAGVNAIWDWRIDEYRRGEEEQFHAMWHALPRRAVCIFDRYFSSFYNIATLRRRGVDVISRLHQRRDPQRLIRNGRGMRPNEWLVPLELGPQLRRRYEDPALPKRLWVRLIRVTFRRGRRTRTNWLVTTLTDPLRHRRGEIIRLYRSRWQIETRLGEIKTTLQADVLRSKSPGGIRRELAAILIGHNVLWWIIHLAARQADRIPEKISFAGAAKTLLAFSHQLAHCHGRQRRARFQTMLHHVARHTHHHPPNRVEPRLLRRDPVRYGILRTSRADERLKCLT